MKYLILICLILMPMETSKADMLLTGTGSSVLGGVIIIPVASGGGAPAGALQDDSGNYLNDDAGHYIVGT